MHLRKYTLSKGSKAKPYSPCERVKLGRRATTL